MNLQLFSSLFISYIQFDYTKYVTYFLLRIAFFSPNLMSYTDG